MTIEREAETVSVEFVRYRVNGEPTCAADFEAGMVCDAYRVAGMCGKREVCALTGAELKRSRGGEGFLIPARDCPLWK